MGSVDVDCSTVADLIDGLMYNFCIIWTSFNCSYVVIRWLNKIWGS